MISELDSGSRGPGFSPGRVTCVVAVGQDTLLSQCLSLPRSINGYQQTVRKPDEMLGGGGGGVTFRWTSIQSRRSRITPGRLMLRKPG